MTDIQGTYLGVLTTNSAGLFPAHFVVVKVLHDEFIEISCPPIKGNTKYGVTDNNLSYQTISFVCAKVEQIINNELHYSLHVCMYTDDNIKAIPNLNNWGQNNILGLINVDQKLLFYEFDVKIEGIAYREQFNARFIA